jgi:hypothetical protein
MSKKLDPHIEPVIPKIARRWVGLMLGFGVSIGVGLAPLLGRLDVPLFSSLLTLIPASLQNRLIALSTAVMSIVAVAIQFYATSEPGTAARLSRMFKRTLIYSVLSFLLFLVVNTFLIERVQVPDGNYVSFVIGFSRHNVPPCTDQMTNAQCIAATTMSETEMKQQWGDQQIKLSELLVQLSYLLFYSYLGALVGLLLIKQESSAAQTRRDR